jgi:serine/threonine-protein kinase SRPK3
LKIVKADISLRSRELSILLHLSESDTEHPGKGHVLQLLDHFEHQGPNGLHLCLVFPVMLSDGEVMTVRDRPRYSGYVREISKQILQGLEVIHSLGLIHGGTFLGYHMPNLTKIDPWLDLQPANILFTVTEFSNSMIVDPELSPVHWRPGVEVDNSAPRYLLTSQRPRGMLDDADFSTLEVRLGDLGGGLIPSKRSATMDH